MSFLKDTKKNNKKRLTKEENSSKWSTVFSNNLLKAKDNFFWRFKIKMKFLLSKTKI